jgi:hypothetical protein
MKAEGPPYWVAIWFVLIAGSIAVTIDLVLFLKPILAPSPNPLIPRCNSSSPVLAVGATGHQYANTSIHANRQL